MLLYRRTRVSGNYEFSQKYNISKDDMKRHIDSGWHINLVIGSYFRDDWFKDFEARNNLKNLNTTVALTKIKKDQDFNMMITRANTNFKKVVKEVNFPTEYLKDPHRPISGDFCWMPEGFYVNFKVETPKKDLVRLLKALARYFQPNKWEKEQYGDYSGNLTFGETSDLELVVVNTKGKIIQGSEKYEVQEVEDLNKKSLTKQEIEKQFDCTIKAGPFFDKEGYCYCIDDHDHRITMLRQGDIENAGFKHDPKGV